MSRSPNIADANLQTAIRAINIVNSKPNSRGREIMDSMQTLTFIILGAVLGFAGQAVRAVIGIKKEIEKAKAENKTIRDWFDGMELSVSLALGAIAGVLAAISVYQPDVLPS